MYGFCGRPTGTTTQSKNLSAPCDGGVSADGGNFHDVVDSFETLTPRT
jgi:hypothetical protein